MQSAGRLVTHVGSPVVEVTVEVAFVPVVVVPVVITGVVWLLEVLVLVVVEVGEGPVLVLTVPEVEVRVAELDDVALETLVVEVPDAVLDLVVDAELVVTVV